jgi:hypothetical protein
MKEQIARALAKTEQAAALAENTPLETSVRQMTDALAALQKAMDKDPANALDEFTAIGNAYSHLVLVFSGESPPPTRESGPWREGPGRSEAPVPAENQEQVKPMVQVGARFVAADGRLLRDLRGRGAIEGMTSPQETEALYEIGRRLSEGKSLVLTADQAGLLMKATPQYRDCSMLAAPQVVVREDEPASLWIGSKISYTAGYEEPNEPAGTPKPRQATLDSGLKFDTTAHLVGQNGVKLDGLLRMTTLLGFDKKKYQGRYPYQVPKTEDVVFSLDSPVVPSSGTSLTLGPKARLLKASDRPQTILILVTPSIVEGKTSR